MTAQVKTGLIVKQDFFVVELFAGAGGLALGLEKAGFKTLATVENNKWACETLRKNRPNWNILEEDYKNSRKRNKKISKKSRYRY